MIKLRVSMRLLNQNVFKRLASTSVEPAKEPNREEYEKDLKVFETLRNVTRKTREKRPQRPPFVKNLIMGVFDTEILTYPQMQTKEEVENLEKEAVLVQKLMSQSHMKKVDSISNKNFRQNLADYRAIGLQAPQLMDGRESGIMESMRFLESLSEHKLRDNIVYNEQLGVQSLVKFANDNLKKKYLHPVIKGEKLISFCMLEPKLSDLNDLEVRAELSADEKSWVLNGSKSWVVNGVSADYFVVVAISDIVHRDVNKEMKFSLFLVEKDSPGVRWEKTEFSDTELATVSFDNTPIPAENVIGEVNEAVSMLNSLITEFRLSCGPICIALTKSLLNNLHNAIVEQVTDKNPLHETDAIRSRVAEISLNLYAMESVTYLTAGLLDSYENQDCFVESSIVKAFCSQSLFDASNSCIDIFGLPTLLKNHWCHEIHEEAIKYLTLHETNESQKLTVALACLAHAGDMMRDKFHKLRNPFFYLSYSVKNTIRNRRQHSDNPKLDLNLIQYLHPSLNSPAALLEYCVKRVEYATEVLLTSYGLEIVNKHIELRRLAECLIDIYVATACLGRASRSYCIGLQHGDVEMLMAGAVCHTVTERVKHRVTQILQGPHNNDENHNAVGKKFFTYNGYFAKHPLTRNF